MGPSTDLYPPPPPPPPTPSPTPPPSPSEVGVKKKSFFASITSYFTGSSDDDSSSSTSTSDDGSYSESDRSGAESPGPALSDSSFEPPSPVDTLEKALEVEEQALMINRMHDKMMKRPNGKEEFQKFLKVMDLMKKKYREEKRRVERLTKPVYVFDPSYFSTPRPPLSSSSETSSSSSSSSTTTAAPTYKHGYVNPFTRELYNDEEGFRRIQEGHPCVSTVATNIVRRTSPEEIRLIFSRAREDAERNERNIRINSAIGSDRENINFSVSDLINSVANS